MKTVSVRDLQKNVRKCVDVAQGEKVVVTRRGRPAAIVIGVEGEDWDDIALRLNPAFWKMIEERRRESSVSLEAARRRLESLWQKKSERPKPVTSKSRAKRKPRASR
jgi:prevent-host-death family protein